MAPNDIWAPADDGQVAGGGEWAVGTDGPAALAELVIRLAAPTTATLAQAEAALRRLGEALGAKVTRLDGAQLDGLAATLPLGGSAPTHEALLAGLLADQAGLALSGANPAHVTARHLAAIQPPIGIEGIMLGVNRHGAPVVVRLFRPTPTRVALIGGHRCAQVVVLRALATGARVVVLSGRPHAWEPFQRGTGAGEALAVLPPARLPDPPPATAMRPQLLVLDVGPVPAGTAPVPEGPWRTLLYVRDDLTEADAAMLGGADLALVQPLSPAEAELAGDALGLGESRGWLARIPAEMLGIVVNRRVVRWALLSTTPIEHQLTGGPAR